MSAYESLGAATPGKTGRFYSKIATGGSVQKEGAVPRVGLTAPKREGSEALGEG